MRRTPWTVAATIAIAIAAASLTLAACGSSSSDGNVSTSTPAATATAPATGTAPAKTQTVAVVLGKPNELSLVVTPTSVSAGKTTFVVTNRGEMVHEMVVVPAPDGAAALKEADGSANEAGSLGEAADLEPGATARMTVTLPAGRYVLLCNLPGHFAGGMWADLTVS